MHLHQPQPLLAAVKQQVEVVLREADGYVGSLLGGLALRKGEGKGGRGWGWAQAAVPPAQQRQPRPCPADFS